MLPALKPFRIKDKPLIDKILLHQNTVLSAYTVASHYIWKDLFRFFWTIIDGYLCLFAQYENCIYMPIPPVPAQKNRSENSKDFQEVISTVFSIMNHFNKNKTISRIENIDGSRKGLFTSAGYEIKAGETEYLYLREDMVNLKGNPYKSKRAMYNYFIKHYPFCYEPFQKGYVDECLKLYEAWKEKRRDKIKDPYYSGLLEDSTYAHRRAIKHFSSLGLSGKVVRINEKVEGYISGFGKGDVFYILLEITNPDIKGLSQFIFREFCKGMDGYTFINTLGDSGLENLRRVKLSFRPHKLIPSCIASLR